MRRFAIGLSARVAVWSEEATIAAAALAAPPERGVQDNRDKAWSLSTQLELARERGEIAPSLGKVPPGIPVINTPIDNPDVKITTATNRTLSENSIAVSPLDNKFLFVANNSTDWPVTQVYGTQVGWSTDGGLTWTSQNEGRRRHEQRRPGGVHRPERQVLRRVYPLERRDDLVLDEHGRRVVRRDHDCRQRDRTTSPSTTPRRAVRGTRHVADSGAPGAAVIAMLHRRGQQV